MSDEVIGTSILQGERLYICGYSPTYKGGYIHWMHIPVTPLTLPKLPSPSWQYEKKGDSLDVTPSVHQRQGKNLEITTFHNNGAWSTKFIEVGPEINAFNKLREINNHLLADKKANDFFHEND